MTGLVPPKGYLKRSLVACKMSAAPAAAAGERMRFGGPVDARRIGSEGAGRRRRRTRFAAFASGEPGFAPIQDERIGAARLESVRTIDISSFAPATERDPIRFDRPCRPTPLPDAPSR